MSDSLIKRILSSIDLGKNQLMNAALHKLSTPPLNPVEGQVYYNIPLGRICYWNGSSWVCLGDVSTSGSYSNPSWITSLAWSKITGAPSFITSESDPIWNAEKANYLTTANAALTYVALAGSYANPSWLSSLAWNKITGAPSFLTSETDPIWTADKPSYLTSATAALTYVALAGSYANPSWITSLDWSKLTGVPGTFTPSAHTHSLSDITVSGATTGQVPSWSGSAWVPTTISTANIYNSDGTLTGNRTVTMGSNTLTFTNNIIVTKGAGNSITIDANTNTNSPYINLFYSGLVNRRISFASDTTFINVTNGFLLSSDGTVANATGLIAQNIVSTGSIGSLGGLIAINSTGANMIRMYQRGVAERGVMGYDANTSYFQIRTGGATSFTDGNLAAAFMSTGNVVIGGATDAGFKLDVQGTGRFVNRLTVDADIYFTNYATTGIVITGPNVVYPLITIGSQNTASGNTNILIGQSNQGTGGAYVLGASNIANSNGSVIIGQLNQANTSGQFTVLIGGSNTTSHGVTTFTGTFAIGNANVLAHQASAIMGSNQTTTANNQLIIAATQSNVNSAGFNDIYFGTGPRSKNSNLLGSNITINGSGAGAGTDLSGGSVTIAGGKGTGAGTPGDVIIATASTTTSGTTLQSLTTRFRVAATTGNVTVSSLSGSGTRMVVADSSGVLSTQTIPAGNPGTVTSITAGTGLTGGTITSSGTIAFDTAWGDLRYQALLVSGTNIKTVNSVSILGSGDIVTNNIYTANGSLTSNRTLTLNGNSLSVNSGSNTAFHLFSNGRAWFGNGTPVDAGFQFEASGSSRWSNGSHRIRGASTSANNTTLIIENSAGTATASFFDNGFVSIPLLTVGTVEAGSSVLTLQSFEKSFATGPAIRFRFSTAPNTAGSYTIAATQQGSWFHTGSNVYNITAFRANESMTNFGGGGITNYTGFYFDPQAEANAGTRTYVAFRNDKGDNLFNTATGTTVFGATASSSASAIVDINSTNRGFLPPRMTAAQRAAISSAAVGLVVYQTDGTEGLYENTSTGWRIVNAAGSGGVSDGDKGDITVSGGGATWTVDNAAITYAKIQNVTDNRILGRSAGSAGTVQEIQIGSGLTLSGGTLSASGGSGYTITTQTSNYTETATSGTRIIVGNTTGGSFTVTLPTAVGNTAVLIIKKSAGSAGLVIDGAGSETIDGGATATLLEVNSSITLVSNNSNWIIV